MTRYSGRTLIEQPSVGSWGQPAAGGIGVVAGYGVATGTPSVSSSYTDGGFTWQRIDFTASSTLVVSTSGLFDVLMISGGGGGGSGGGGGNFEGSGGGSGSQIILNTLFIPAATYTVTVGAAGATATNNQSDGGALGGQSGIATLKLSAYAGVNGGPPWGFGIKSYNSSGASYRSGYGGNAAIAGVGLFGFAGGSSDGAGNNGGGGGSGGAGATRTAGVGTTLTFTGTSVTYAAGGLGGGTSGTLGAAGGANTGTGGGGGIANAAGNNGGSGFVCIRWRIS